VIRVRPAGVYGPAAAVFLAAGSITAYFALTMRGGMPMPGGWTMSMMWMRMPAQSLAGAAAMFAIMWVAMMVAMMLPSSLPMLMLYHRAAAFARARHAGVSTWLLGTAYFGVWLAFGLVAYAIGLMIASWTMRSEWASRAVPIVSGAAIVMAGIYQLTSAKTACLTHCRDPLHLVAEYLDRGPRGALSLGLHHGAYCAGCCWALMLIQLAIGVMNVGAMIGIAAVIAIEKSAPRGDLVARVVGLAAVAAGMLMVFRAAAT
jgi:predicted metal-binding membrane protein